MKDTLPNNSPGRLREVVSIDGAIICQTCRHLSNSVEEVIVGVNLIAEQQDKPLVVLLAAFGNRVECGII